MSSISLSQGFKISLNLILINRDNDAVEYWLLLTRIIHTSGLEHSLKSCRDRLTGYGCS